MIGDSYITRNQLAAYLGIPLAVTDPSRDSKLDAAIAAASRAVEDHTRRQFNTDGAAIARVYGPTARQLVTVDDFFDTTTLVVQRSTLGSSTWQPAWSSTDFEVEPRNGVVNGRPGWPYRTLKFPFWTYLWATDRIKVTAKWGWPSVPTAVTQAVYIIAAQYFKLSDAPLGVAGFGSGSDGFSAVRVRDVPQAWSLLCDYVIDPITVA